MASTCGRPALFPSSLLQETAAGPAPLETPCPPPVALLYSPRGCVCVRVWICLVSLLLCACRTVCCQCVGVYIYLYVCMCECGLYRGRSRRRQVPLPFDVFVRPKNTEMCLQTSASVTPARFATKFA